MIKLRRKRRQSAIELGTPDRCICQRVPLGTTVGIWNGYCEVKVGQIWVSMKDVDNPPHVPDAVKIEIVEIVPETGKVIANRVGSMVHTFIPLASLQPKSNDGWRLLTMAT